MYFSIGQNRLQGRFNVSPGNSLRGYAQNHIVLITHYQASCVRAAKKRGPQAPFFDSVNTNLLEHTSEQGSGSLRACNRPGNIRRQRVIQ